MDETGQAGSPDAGGAYPGANPSAGRGRGAYPDGHVGGGTPPTDDALEAIVSAWREPTTGAIAGRATVGGLNGNGNGNGNLNGNGNRGRAEVRGSYSDLLAPMSPPVSAPPPAQPPTSTLHYGHYGPDGQGWPTTSATGETNSVPAPGTVYGQFPPEHAGQPAPQPQYEQPQYEQPQHQQYEQPQQYDQPSQQYQPQQPEWGYNYQQHYQQPEQRHWAPEPSQPEFDWAAPQPQPQQPPAAPHEIVPQPATHQLPPPATHRVPLPPTYQVPGPATHPVPPPSAPPVPSAPPMSALPMSAPPMSAPPMSAPPMSAPPMSGPPMSASPASAAPMSSPPVAPPLSVPPRSALPQQLPAQRLPEDDPLVGPLPPVLLGPSTRLSAGEPVMPSFADQMTQPEYEPPELPQRVPAEPDVPPLAAVESTPVAVGAPELTRITNKLREDEDGTPESPDDRPDGFDVQSVLRAVQTVSGVHRATLRKNADGLHTLRLELADEADAGQVSRIVARMLNDTMGLSAEQNPLLPDFDPPASASAVSPASSAVLPAGQSSRNSPHSALPGYTRESRRRRPVSSGARRPTEPKAPALTPNPGAIVSPRVVIESVDVNTQGIDATVEVRLTADNQPAIGVASGPNFDGYMLKLAALAAASAVDQLLIDSDATVRARCYIEHAAVVALGGCEVAVVVLLLMYDGFVEQLTGSAVVAQDGDSRQAVVRATMAAVNRRLEALLP